jgi:hypothetical protein
MGLYVKNLLFLPHLIKLVFSLPICERKPQIPNFMKIRPVRAELFHADRQPLRDNSLFHNFANVPEDHMLDNDLKIIHIPCSKKCSLRKPTVALTFILILVQLLIYIYIYI